MPEKILLILDLDETLIHSTDKPHDELWDFQIFHYKVYKRPYLKEFLEFLPEHFKVAVWSSASDDYVKGIVHAIFPPHYPLQFVWGRSRCTFRPDYNRLDRSGYYDPFSHYDYVKRLDKLRKTGWPKRRMLIIDDTPAKCVLNYGNAIYPSEFTGQKTDRELLDLSQYLLSLKDLEDVRPVEKRYWRDHLNTSR